MQAALDAFLGIFTGLFSLGEADLMTIGINMIMGLSMFLPMTVGQLSFGQAGFMSIGAHVAVVEVDTQTGRTWAWFNPAGRVPAPVRDVEAFSCP